MNVCVCWLCAVLCSGELEDVPTPRQPTTTTQLD